MSKRMIMSHIARPMRHAIRSTLHALRSTIVLVCLAAGAARAQFVAQRYQLSQAERTELAAGRDHLRMAVDALAAQSRKSGQPKAEQIPDAEIYLDAVDRSLRQELFFSPQQVTQARACLKEGEERAAALA